MPPSRKLKVVDNNTNTNCVGCDLLKQRDEMNEQNIAFHRQDMAERWRLQEEVNKSLTDSYTRLNTLMAGHMDKLNERFGEHLGMIHKLEKSVIYAAIAVGVSAVGTIAAAIVSLVIK